MGPLHVETPVWESLPLSRALGARVLLKLEALQPVGSFKIRGIGAAAQARVAAGAERLVISSGGNAGYALAYAARRLDVPATVVVPTTTSSFMREIIAREDAEVVVHGESWSEAHAHATRLAAEGGAGYVHPFDDPDVWAGNATLVDEVAKTMRRPGALCVSVGGGGLLCGVLEGLHRVGWGDVPVLAVETLGADSFAAALRAGRVVELPAITSIATTLGAKSVAPELMRWTRRHPITSWTVPDRAALDACLRFADDHRLLVEPACGAALAPVYAAAEPLCGRDPVLVVVCGGAGVSRDLLTRWDREVPPEEKETRA